MRMAQFYCLFVSIAALLGGTTTQVAADLIIDEFDEITTGDWPLFTTGPVVKTTDLGLASVLGGRRFAVTNISPEPVTPGIDYIRANVDTDRGLLEYAHSSGAPGLLFVEYHRPASFDFGDFVGLRVDFADVVIPDNQTRGVGIELLFNKRGTVTYFRRRKWVTVRGRPVDCPALRSGPTTLKLRRRGRGEYRGRRGCS